MKKLIGVCVVLLLVIVGGVVFFKEKIEDRTRTNESSKPNVTVTLPLESGITSSAGSTISTSGLNSSLVVTGMNKGEVAAQDYQKKERDIHTLEEQKKRRPSVPEASDSPMLAFANFQKASVVIGQREFTKKDVSLRPDRSTVKGPYGNPLFYRGKLFVPDMANNRILVFNKVPTHNNADADFVLGQSGFSSYDYGNGNNRMRAPLTIRGCDNRLFVTDHFNHRVLIWNELPSQNAGADIVIGQNRFGIQATVQCSATNLYVPTSISVAAGKLIVADMYHNRVLIWNKIPENSGERADIVLGQPDMTTCAEDVPPSTTTLSRPSDVWSDGKKLIVADQLNNRILIWSKFPTENQTPADIVLGQKDMNASVPGISANSLNNPFFIASNGKQLYVSDHKNNRVLIWNSIPKRNNVAADIVLGQSDFTHNTPNDSDQDGIEESQPGAMTLKKPTGIALLGEKIIVGDEGNNRYLIFNGTVREE